MDEQLFIQNQHATNFKAYMTSVWQAWPSLKYAQVRRKASKLWKARKAWLKTLEPTPNRLKRNCDSCSSSFHDIWSQPVPAVIVSLVEWEDMIGDSRTCKGCKDHEQNQLGHMDYGGCLYQEACDMGLVDYMQNLPPLPPSPCADLLD